MAKDDIAISVKNVSKSFKLPHEKQNSVKGMFLGMFSGKRTYERQQVLKDISFNIKKGEFFGIVGRNGSGKSTLLKLMAGIYSPDNGYMQVNGKLTPFIELGVGFNPELTGRENVYLNGALLGFSRSEMEAMYDEIVEFAELDKFMDQKLKNYSSGMQVRLAFSIAIRANTDILVLDEVLAVGDEAFQRKCTEYFVSIKKSNKTIVLVTHDMTYVERFCSRAIVIDKGSMIINGTPYKAKKSYESLNRLQSVQNSSTSIKDANERWGSGEATIAKAYLKGKKTNPVVETGEKVSFKFKIESELEIPVIVGIAIEDSGGVNISGPNTGRLEVFTNQTVDLTIDKLPLNSGRYYVRVALFDKDQVNEYDHIERAIVFDVVSGGKQVSYGKVDLFGSWSVE